MASTYTTLGIEKMATGENAGTWGTKTNTNLDIINVAVSGYVEQAVTSGGTLALSITDGAATATAQNAVIKLTGTITGNSIVTVPDSVEKVYIVTNGTSGAYTVQFKTASGTGVTFGVSEKTTKLLYSDGTNIVDAGFSGALDIEGRELVLDADGDTTITADTDDQIDIKIAGADDFQFTANTFTAQSGSTIAAQALTATTVTASGILKTDDTTEATSTTDGSLQTDGGLSVAKDAVIGDDLKLLSDSAVLSFGADSDITVTHAADTGLTTNGTFQATTITATTAFVPDASDGAALGTSALEFSDLFLADGAVVNFGDDQDVSLTHVADTGLLLSSTDQLQFGDSGTYIHQSADGVLDLVSDTEIEINATTIDINGAVDVSGNLSVGGNLDVTGTLDLSDSNFTNVGSLQLDSIAGDGDTNTSITFSGSDVITIATGGSGRLTIGDGALSPVTDNEIDLGTSSLEFKDAYFDGTVTADAFAGPLTGDVTGNVSGTAATVTTAAQSNITSLGTLTTLTVDNVIINGTTIGHTSDTDLITIADGVATVAGEVSMTTLDIGGTNVTATAAEINLIDGGTARGTTAVADGDGILINDAGTMRMTTVQTVSTYMSAESVGGSNIVTTGALNSGSITSGFGTIDTGSSTITTTGLISGGSLDIDNVLINGTTIGHTDDTDLLTVADGLLTVAGEISVTTLDIGGTNVASTAAELNIMDGGTSATGTTLVDADRLVTNDAGTMKQVALSDVKTYLTSAGFTSDDPTALAIALG